VKRTGIKMRNMIQSKYDTGGKGTSSVMLPSSAPPGNWRKIESYSNSPVVMVMVLTMARPGVANEDLCGE
jgi:hypothetical protein